MYLFTFVNHGIHLQLPCQELPQRLAQPGAAQLLRERLLEELRKEMFFPVKFGDPPRLLKLKDRRDAHHFGEGCFFVVCLVWNNIISFFKLTGVISGGGLHSFNELAGNGQSEHRGSESFLPSMGAFLGVRRAQWMWMWLLYQRVFFGLYLRVVQGWWRKRWQNK